MVKFDGLNMKFIEKTKIGTIYEYPYNNKRELTEILKVARSQARKNNLPDIIGVNICEGYVQWCQPDRGFTV